MWLPTNVNWWYSSQVCPHDHIKCVQLFSVCCFHSYMSIFCSLLFSFRVPMCSWLSYAECATEPQANLANSSVMNVITAMPILHTISSIFSNVAETLILKMFFISMTTSYSVAVQDFNQVLKLWYIFWVMGWQLRSKEICVIIMFHSSRLASAIQELHVSTNK